MAIEHTGLIALHLRSTSDDSVFIDAFQCAGIAVQSVSLLADAVTALNVLATSFPVVFAIAPAQQGGVSLLELLAEVNLLACVKVVLIDHESDTRTAIRALRLGAADYFTCDMPAHGVQARIQVLLAGQAPTANEPALPADEAAMSADFPAPIASTALPEDISINANLRAIRKGDMWVSLSPIEWRLFEELTQNRGRVVQFAELVRRGLNRERVTPSETSLLRLHMSRLRSKLNTHFERELNIITLRGRGYMMA